MNEYMKSTLWKVSFESSTEHKDAQEMLKNCYINMRKRAETLVGQIEKDIPSLTVHDITHLDALWENASLIAGNDCDINPMEAFILGGSILLHDAAMSLAAFSNRKEELKNTPQWKDAVVDLDEKLTDEEVEAKVVPTVLRLLHAEKAEELPKVEWKLNGGDSAYIIENSEIRNFYGEIIGQIARSHWLSVKEVESEFSSKVTPAGEGIPSEWTVDVLKIACLLRCADASHIDASRAPSFLWAMVEPKGVSHHHWAFQNKLGKVQVKKHSLVIASGSSFQESEVESWWLAYDVALMIDKELRQVDMLLEALGKKQFEARKVANVESPEHFAKKLGTKGWFPVDASLKITNVSSIVETLGGSHLYGDSVTAPIRELIQNAADAIRARRILTNQDENFGKIKVSLVEKEGDDWLVVEDNGIGMSKRVLVDHLLDFGKSFWSSGGVQSEFPGLMGRGMSNTGKYGIGFFSVFMIGEKVTVTSRRYDYGMDESHTLDFLSGISLRPMVRKPTLDEGLTDGGTKVAIKLKKKAMLTGGILSKNPFFLREGGILELFVGNICPSLDVTVETEEFGNVFKVVTANDWKEIEGAALVNRIERKEYNRIEGKEYFGFDDEYNDMRDLIGDDGVIYGRAMVRSLGHGTVTIGGLSSCRIQGIKGILLGEALGSSRNAGRALVPKKVLKKWASEQAKLFISSSYSRLSGSRVFSLLYACGAELSNFPFIRGANISKDEDGVFSLNSFQEEIKGLNSFFVCEGVDLSFEETNDKDITPKAFEEFFLRRENVYQFPQAYAHGGDWLDKQEVEFTEFVEEILQDIVAKAWGEAPVIQESKQVIGEVEGVEVVRSVIVFSKGDFIDGVD